MASIPYYRKGHVRKAVAAKEYDPLVKQYVEGERNGFTCLIETGVSDFFGMIQAGKDECDVYALIRRYNAGDLDALNERVGSFVDVSEVPSDVFAMKEYLNSVSAKFEALPNEVKALYQNSASVFFDRLQTNGQEHELKRIGECVAKAYNINTQPQEVKKESVE